jgi:hypothetical protein
MPTFIASTNHPFSNQTELWFKELLVDPNWRYPSSRARYEANKAVDELIAQRQRLAPPDYANWLQRQV